MQALEPLRSEVEALRAEVASGEETLTDCLTSLGQEEAKVGRHGRPARPPACLPALREAPLCYACPGRLAVLKELPRWARPACPAAIVLLCPTFCVCSPRSSPLASVSAHRLFARVHNPNPHLTPPRPDPTPIPLIHRPCARRSQVARLVELLVEKGEAEEHVMDMLAQVTREVVGVGVCV